MSNIKKILNIVVGLFAFKKGCDYEKSKILNNTYKIQNKLNKKINKEKVKNKQELIKKIKKGLFCCIFVICCSCSNRYFNKITIDVVEYTEEENKELINFLQKNNNIVIEKYIIDYYNLRETIKIYNEL